MWFAPKPLKGLVNGTATEKRHKRRKSTEHGTAHGNARRKRTNAGSGQPVGSQVEAGRQTDRRKPDGSPMDAQWTAVAQRQAAQWQSIIMERMSFVADEGRDGRGKR